MDQRQTCQFENVCLFRGDNASRGELIFFQHPAAVVRPPTHLFSYRDGPTVTIITKTGSLCKWLASLQGGSQEAPTVHWVTGPVVFWHQPESQSHSRYYELLVESLGSLFWLAWDTNHGEPLDDVILLNRLPEPLPFARSMTHRPDQEVTLASRLPLGVTCFQKAGIGGGCRSLWWQDTSFLFQPPRMWVDFLGLEAGQYLSARNGTTPTIAAEPALSRLRQWLMAGFGLYSPTGVSDELSIVFQSRWGGKRHLVNEEAVAARVVAQSRHPLSVTILRMGASSGETGRDNTVEPLPRGIRVVYYPPARTTLSIKAQAQVVGRASVLVGPHGAGLSSMIFMAPGSKVLEIVGHGHVNEVFRGLAGRCGHSYALWRPPPSVWGTSCGDPTGSECKNANIIGDVDALASWILKEAGLSLAGSPASTAPSH